MERATKQQMGRATSKTSPNKDIEVSVTICQAGENIPGEIFKKMTAYLHNQAECGIISVERDDTNLQLHLLCVLIVKSTSTQRIKAAIYAAIGGQKADL
ncbi:hypothetical protein R1flu_028537 [Riccia fluitans]|uniref:Uncharacterized protein n=1 Tax=Riccia fluitans TaxID=41844 RepID=A0ABD1XLZ1_9MARC